MNLFLKELNDLKTRFLVLFFFIGITAYFIIAYYDFFISLLNMYPIQESLDISPLNKYIDTAAIMQQLALLPNIDYYLWSQWFGKNLSQIIILSTILLAFSSFAREAEHNTMSFLLSNFTRGQIFTSKILAGGILLIVLVAEGCFLPLVLVSQSTYSFTLIQAGSYLLQVGSAAIFLYAAVILFSILSKDLIKPIIASIVLLMVLGLPRLIKPLSFLYFYRYIIGADIFAGNGVHYLAVILLTIGSAALLTLAWQIYRKKDF